jgi:hypothetical protein
MFHPYFFHNGFFPVNHHTLADTMRLVSAFNVEQDLLRARREEREQQDQSDLSRILEQCRI